MPNDFENAKAATEEMFEADAQMADSNDPVTEETVQPEQPVENPAQNAATTEQATLEDASRTAEIAAQTAAQKDAQLQQAMQQIEALKTQNTQLQGTVDELSRQNEQELVEETLEPPILDVNNLAFADEETIKGAQSKYASEMAEYTRKQIMKELSPFVEQAKEGMYEKEKKETLSALSQIPELDGIENMMPQIEKIIKNNKALSSDDIPLDEKIITAYAIAKGVNSINTPPQEHKEPTIEELMGLYNNNPAFQEMVEKQRIEQLKNSQQVPPFSASSGAVNAALNIKEKPKTFEEASQLSRQMFSAE